MFFPHLLMQAAKAHIFAGKIKEAQRYLDQAMQLAESRQYRQLPAIGQRLQGRIWQTQGKFEQAQPCFERSLAELLALGDIVEHARTEEAYGLFYLARGQEGDAERGQALIESAKATFKRLGVNG
jgi:tetratricopeptide (TPR) repeat protein